jgi:chemotaxis protein CheD
MTDTHSRSAPEWRRVHIVQGEQHIDDDPRTILTTILGSCIAACLWDTSIGIGGMNHFLLPGDPGGAGALDLAGGSMRYGVYAMELLVNSLLRRGAQRKYLQAKLFGGASMVKGLADIGDLNAAFAERYLQAEGIAIIGGSLRGVHGRRIQFWPVTGRARQVLLGQDNKSAFQAERQVALPPAFVAPGTVELF